MGEKTHVTHVRPRGERRDNHRGLGGLRHAHDRRPGAGQYTYTDRTFTVTNGVVSYSGPHDFADNKIRLMPYNDTSNPGGVYILAICSLADGYPANASDCKYDSFSRSAAAPPSTTTSPSATTAAPSRT